MLFRAAKERSDAGFGVKTGEAVYLDLLSQYSATERTGIHKGLDASDEKLIIKLELQ
jgi:hypothetical protein